ncbi:hypothetical protein MKX03_020734 [Papaver bracteatum]|nr:hypothetical protein MKX03_020734 [Papaver bracteatum]
MGHAGSVRDQCLGTHCNTFLKSSCVDYPRLIRLITCSNMKFFRVFSFQQVMYCGSACVYLIICYLQMFVFGRRRSGNLCLFGGVASVLQSYPANFLFTCNPFTFIECALATISSSHSESNGGIIVPMDQHQGPNTVPFKNMELLEISGMPLPMSLLLQNI